MGKQRNPFRRRDTVGLRTTDQLMPATGNFHEFCLAELVDDLAMLTLREEIFQFHTPQL